MTARSALRRLRLGLPWVVWGNRSRGMNAARRCLRSDPASGAGHRVAARLISTLIGVLAILVGASPTLAAPDTTASPIQVRVATATLNVSSIGSALGTVATRTTTPSVFSSVARASGPRRAGGSVALIVGFVAAEDAARVPFGPGTEKAWNVFDRVTAKGSPSPGFKGGGVFKNAEGRLPGFDGAGNPVSYREWDVNPYVKGVDRGAERVVTGSDGAAYYTGDHYDSFLQFSGPK